MQRPYKLAVVFLFAVLAVACFGESLIGGFKSAFGQSRPYVQKLVERGLVTQEQADKAVLDVDDGVNAADQAITCLKAVNVSGPAKRVAKGKCYFSLAQNLRTILARHNIGGQTQLDQIAAIASGAIEALEAYYTSVTTGPVIATDPDGGIITTGADGIDGSDADKELESRLNDLKRQLKELTEGSQ